MKTIYRLEMRRGNNSSYLLDGMYLQTLENFANDYWSIDHRNE